MPRFFLALIGLLLAGAGFWWALVDRDRQFLHDRIAGNGHELLYDMHEPPP
ncbi:MAG: RDD family protein [Candidatus Thermoplasmatota archaeon]|nr:RDD family protein [Candidatus Thermoplasmatota archaeon]